MLSGYGSGQSLLVGIYTEFIQYRGMRSACIVNARFRSRYGRESMRAWRQIIADRRSGIRRLPDRTVPIFDPEPARAAAVFGENDLAERRIRTKIDLRPLPVIS